MTLPLTYHPKSPSTNTWGYRYFFNGQEGDNEVFGEVANFGYEFRQYDSRLGRWWGIDPKWNEYPGISPYVFCNGSPIMLVDLKGTEAWKPEITESGDIRLNAEDGDNLNSLTEFLGGKNGINEVLESRYVFAIILPPDNHRIVLKMKDSRVQTQELDMFNIFLLLCTSDMLNQGIDFELYKEDIKQDWKIYPKDNIGLLIDNNLGSTQSGRIYNEGILKNRGNGFYIDRVKPKDDPKHDGDSGEIVYKDHWLFYILKVNDKYVAMERNDFTYMKSEIGDVIIGDFSVLGEKKVFYNKSRDIEGYSFIVYKAFEKYEDCLKFIKSKMAILN